ncbi:aerolysin-like protein [Megalops cyprinoides]|uniref:aerolysin-like protein n=1 Tax=Megalops cyprinoides TaxID=118141 RepID=UPI00186421CC|nr:aerolysin-like protein [Megalops cyprinoides]
MSTIVQKVGGTGGKAFSLSGTENGAVLNKIRVWTGKSWVTSIKVWLTDGSAQVFGTSHGPYKEFQFGGGEKFTSLTLWRSKDSSHVGGIHFKTNRDREFTAMVTDFQQCQEVIMDIGSGICLGVTGTHYWDVNSLGFVFLQSIQYSQVTNVQYPTLTGAKPSVEMEEKKIMTYQNDSGEVQEYRMEVTTKWTKKSEWSMTHGINDTFTFKVKAAIPELENSAGSYILVLGPEEFRTVSFQESATKTFTEKVKVDPGQVKHVTARMGKAYIQLPYQAVLEINFKGGAKMEINIKGIYTGLAYTDVIFSE